MIVGLFWVLMGVIAYTYVGFPLLVYLRGRLWRREFLSGDATPSVSLIIAAHNEEAGIGEKIENVLALDYPSEQLDIIIASDGSTDRTEAIVSSHSARGVRLLALPRQGKAAALNAAVAVSVGEILVFSDANSMFSRDAVRQLVRPLADPRVGGVAGDQRYGKGSGKGTVGEGEQTYWNFDRWLKCCQSRAGNVISATGAIYAIRRRLFHPVPEGVTDDLVTSTRVIAQGYRLVFAPDAAAYEPAADSGRVEFGRKVRIMTRGFRSLIVMRGLFNPLRHGFYAVQLFSHKVLRRVMVVPLGLVLLLSVWLWSEGVVYRAAFLAQIAFYALGLLGLILQDTRFGKTKAVSLPCYFCLVNAASLVAAWNVLRGQRIVVWKPQRSPLPSDDTTTSSPSRGVPHAAGD